MSPEQLSAKQIVFFESTKKMAQNVSKLLAREGKTVIIENVYHNGENIQLKKRG